MALSLNADDGEARFAAYVATLGEALGHAGRVAPFRSYCTGLLLPGDRKSVEPMAARVEPGRVRAAHQSLHHFVAKAEWPDEAVLAAVRARVLPAIEQQGPLRAWMIDDTGVPKKGMHSVGVARQYRGQLGKQDNCQVAVTLSVANDHASLPLAHRLYLPKSWAEDPERRARVGVPDDVTFRTRPAIALWAEAATGNSTRKPEAARTAVNRVRRISPSLCEGCWLELPADAEFDPPAALDAVHASIGRAERCEPLDGVGEDDSGPRQDDAG